MRGGVEIITGQARSAPAGFAAIASLLLVALDSIRAHRSNFWTGDSLLQMAAPVVPFVMYAAIVYLLSGLLLRVVPRRFATSVEGAAAAVWCSASALAGLIVMLSADFTMMWAIAFSIGVAVAFICLSTLNRIAILPLRLGMPIAVFSILVAWPAMHAMGHTFYIHDSRHTLTTVVAGVWPLLAASTMFALVARGPLHGYRRVMATFLIFVASPLAALSIVRHDAEAIVPDDPSLILGTFDALRADYCSVYGGPAEMPNFERIAREGVVFEHTYALAPWTLPSVNSLYSSTYPYGLTPGAPWDQWRREVTGYAIDTTQKTLAQRLQSKGYATALLTGNALLGQDVSIRRGFDTFFRLGPDVEGLTGAWAYVPCFRQVLEVVAPPLADSQPVDTTRVLTAYAQAFVRDHRGQPIFMWLHYLDPHDPYNPPARFRNDTGPWNLFQPRSYFEKPPDQREDGVLDLASDEVSHVRSLYEAEIRYVDEALGIVLDTSRKSGHGGNAVIALSADHGEELWDHGKWGHGHTMYDEVIRVPLIIKAPGLEPGSVSVPFSHIDLIPTLADLVGAGQDPVWQGRSQLANLKNSGSTSVPAVFTRATHPYCADEPLEMTVSDPFKLIVGLESAEAKLYNLREDPDELVNLAHDDTETLKVLKESLGDWRTIAQATYGGSVSGQEAPVNEDVLEIMDSLGYIQ